MEPLLISEVAERTGFAPSTLRYYEDIGLLPAPGRTDAGYRCYDEQHLSALSFIDRGKRLGLSLEAIGELFAVWRTGDCGRTRAEVQHLLRGKLADLDRELAELHAFREQLRQALERLTTQPVPHRCGPGCGCPPEVEDPPAPVSA